MYNISTVSSVSVEVGNKIKFEFSKKKKKKKKGDRKRNILWGWPNKTVACCCCSLVSSAREHFLVELIFIHCGIPISAQQNSANVVQTDNLHRAN